MKLMRKITRTRRGERRNERPLRPYFSDCDAVCSLCASVAHLTVDCPLAPWRAAVAAEPRSGPIDTRALPA